MEHDVRVQGAGGEMQFSHDDWHHVFLLANQYGWMPTGTLAIDSTSESDDGTLMFHDDERPTIEEADLLADGLERALPHIPNENMPRTTLGVVSTTDPRSTPCDDSTSPEDSFTGDNNQKIIAIIVLCRDGAGNR